MSALSGLAGAGGRLLGVAGVGGAALFWWVILPYAALLTFVIGHIWRYRYDQFGWTSRSTELQERRALKWGSPLFHYGAFTAIGGHILGILIPESATRAIGIPEGFYREFSAIAGTIAAVAVIVGVLILAGRRLFVARVRATTSPVDWLALILLAIIIGLGIVETVGVGLLGSHYNYRVSISPWFRSLFTGRPDVRAALAAPLVPDPCHRGLGPHRGVALQPTGPCLELPVLLPVAAVHRVPKAGADPPQRAGHQRPAVAAHRDPVLSGLKPLADRTGRGRPEACCRPDGSSGVDRVNGVVAVD